MDPEKAASFFLQAQHNTNTIPLRPYVGTVDAHVEVPKSDHHAGAVLAEGGMK